MIQWPDVANPQNQLVSDCAGRRCLNINTVQLGSNMDRDILIAGTERKQRKNIPFNSIGKLGLILSSQL